MKNLVPLTEEQGEILEFIDKTNNEIAEDYANKIAKEKGFRDVNEMYIKELYEMKEKIVSASRGINGWTHDLIKERRAINNEIEKVVGIKKNNNALYFLNEIRSQGKDLYTK